MKTLKFLFLFLALATVGLTSCTKEDVTNTETDTPTEINPEEGTYNPLIKNISSRSEEGWDLECFTIDYPFSLDISGEIVEVTADTELTELFTDLDEDDFVDFVYPLDITYEDGTTAVISSGEELGEAFAECIPDEGWGIDTLGIGGDAFPAFLINMENSCYDLVYPVSLVDLEGNQVSVANEGELVEALADIETWYFFDYPLTLTGEDGEVTANDTEELWSLLLACDDYGWGDDSTINFYGEVGCYDIEYPFSVVLVDSSQVQVNNHDEFCALMIEGGMVGFVYPITLIDADGESITVNNEADFQAALDDCWGGPVTGEFDPSLAFLLTGSNEGGDVRCYDINWPITLEADDEEVSVAGFEDLLEYLDNLQEAVLVYPVSVTLNDSGEVVTLSSIDDLFDLLEDCQ